MLFFVKEMLELAFSKDCMTTPAAPNFDMTLVEFSIQKPLKNTADSKAVKISIF